MPVLKGRRANGHPIAITLPTGTPPSQVGSLAAGTPTTTTIPVTYTAATGTATISYSGQTSTDGGTTYVANGGTFTGTGGTFTGLSPATAYRLRIIATNGFLPDSATALAGSVTTASPAATTYTASISPSSGLSGSSFSYTVTPATGGWPSGEVITPTVTGGSVSPTSATGSGTTPVVFTVTATGGGGTNCTVNSTAPGMTNSTGTLTYSITNPATLGANRYDILVSDASGDTATARTVSAVPNGVWGGNGAKAITLTATKVGGGTSSVGSITLPSSGSTTQTVLWTPPSAGEWTITGTNTASMHNPLGAYYTVFASSAGTAQTISANSSYFLDQQPFQQDNWSGTPNNFSAINGYTLGMGWGIFQIQATTGGTSAALYGQLFDSDSGATTAAGTGTAVTNAAQIYGAVGSGAITVNVNLPSSDVTYYLDIATNSGMTNRARIPLRFRITDVVAIMSRSMECGWMQCYPYPGPPGSTAYSTYTKTMVLGSQNPGGIAMPVWQRADGVNGYGYFGAVFGSVGSQEAGRMWLQRKGRGCALVGCAPAGFSTDDFLASDGSPPPGFTDAVGKCNNKFRYLKTLLNGWTGTYATESYSEYQTLYGNFASKMPALYPALAVMAVGISSGEFGGDGSNGIGYVRVNKIITDQIEPSNPMVISADAAPDWDEWTSGHATWPSQMRYVRAGVRAMLMADGAHVGGYGLSGADRFATFSNTGAVSGDNLFLPFTLPSGASNLVAKQWANGMTTGTFVYTTPAANQLRTLFSVYAGATGAYPAQIIHLTGITIDNVNKRLVLALDRSAGAGTVKYGDGSSGAQPAQFTVQVFSDFNRDLSDISVGVGIFDDRALDDCGYGPHARPQLDVVCS